MSHSTRFRQLDPGLPLVPLWNFGLAALARELSTLAFAFRISDFGLLSDFGFRISDFARL
jgi:hypothetical protein